MDQMLKGDDHVYVKRVNTGYVEEEEVVEHDPGISSRL